MKCVALSRLALRTQKIHNGMQGKSTAYVYKQIGIFRPPEVPQETQSNTRTDGRTRNTVLYISGIYRGQDCFPGKFH